MEVVIAKNSGLCYGVKRALQIAKETRKQKTGQVYTLGDLIHNPQVILDLAKLDIHSIDDLDRIEEGTVIIRSHGVSPQTYDTLTKKNIEIVRKNIKKINYIFS